MFLDCDINDCDDDSDDVEDEGLAVEKMVRDKVLVVVPEEYYDIYTQIREQLVIFFLLLDQVPGIGH